MLAGSSSRGIIVFSDNSRMKSLIIRAKASLPVKVENLSPRKHKMYIVFRNKNFGNKICTYQCKLLVLLQKAGTYKV